MIENSKCIQFTQGPWVPCRGTEGLPNQFFPDSQGRCPFSQCMAFKILSDPELLKRIVPQKDQEEAERNNSWWSVRMLVFHAICPGDHNVLADANIISQYSISKDFLHNHS